MTYWPHYANVAIADYGAQQHPLELASLLAILDTYDPLAILEIGTWSGGLTWALCRLPKVETVVTVDRELQPGWARSDLFATKGVHYVEGDSTHRDTQERVASLMPEDQYDVLVIDGGHDRATCTSDWNNYQGLVSDRGLVVFHDTQGYPGRPDIEVPAVWQTIRRGYRSMELVAVPGGPYGTGIIWKG